MYSHNKQFLAFNAYTYIYEQVYTCICTNYVFWSSTSAMQTKHVDHGRLWSTIVVIAQVMYTVRVLAVRSCEFSSSSSASHESEKLSQVNVIIEFYVFCRNKALP